MIIGMVDNGKPVNDILTIIEQGNKMLSHMVNPMSSLVHFWAKSFKTFHEILCSRIFPCLILPYNRSRSIQGHHLNYLVSTLVPDATCKVSRPLVNWFWRRRFKGFYHIWAWWPYRSCDLDSLNIFLF